MKGYKTVIFNVLSIVSVCAGAFLVYADRLDLDPLLAAKLGLGATIANGVANLFLRMVTTTPVGHSE